jgi:hypothetical protein
MNNEVASNQRGSERREFGVRQRVAIYDGKRLPEAEAFQVVECCNISQSGIAFFWAGEPYFQRVIVELGTIGSATYIAAHVVRSCRADDGSQRYMVGCQFTKKVDLPGWARPTLDAHYAAAGVAE